jgi:hypothetical protein
MSATVADEFPPLLLTEGGPGDALLRRLKLQPLGLGARRTAIVLAAVTWIPLLILSAIKGVAVSGPQIPDAQEEPLLGTADIQSLADLGNSYALAKGMRALPITTSDFVAMAIPGVIPAIPLAATVMPISEVVKGLLKLLV